MSNRDNNKGRLTVRLDERVAKRFGLMVDMLGTTRTQVVQDLVDDWIEDNADRAKAKLEQLTGSFE